MLLCRFKLMSRGFLSPLSHVRSMMKYDDVERIPVAVALLRQLLWAQSLVPKIRCRAPRGIYCLRALIASQPSKRLIVSQLAL